MTFFRPQRNRSRIRSCKRTFRCIPIHRPKKKKPYISLIHKAFCFLKHSFSEASRAENETRTRDPNLGKVVLYQLSYFRKIIKRTLLLSISANLFLRAPSSPFSAGEALRFGDAKVRLKFNFTNYYEKKLRFLPILCRKFLRDEMKGRVLCPAFAHSVVVRKSAGVRLRFENYFFSPQPQFFNGILSIRA